MMRFVLPCVASAATLFVSLPAHATGTLTRTFVSSSGVDSNPCTIAAPCASFAQAYSQVAANGIVAALDPGKYGPLTITGPVTIDGNGWAAITAASGAPGINIHAGTSDNVILRGLTIDGARASGSIGIQFAAGGSLAVDGCTIRNTDSYGMYFASFSSAETLTVSDSFFIDSVSANGIFISALSSGSITASINRTSLSGNGGNGLDAANNGSSGAVNVAFSDSVAANNNRGLVVDGSGTSVVNLVVTNSLITGNVVGVKPFIATGTISLAQSSIVANTAGFDASVGPVDSFGDNYFAANGGNNGNLTGVSKQ